MTTFSDFQDGNEFKDEFSLFERKHRMFEIKKIKVQKKWTKEEDTKLIELAKKFNNRNWKTIAAHFADKSPLQCFSRFKRIRPGIVKGSWTKEEDQMIIELVHKYGKSWSKISKAMVSRNGKQIRDRYLNILDPNVRKEKFAVEEDLLLLRLFRKYGPKWAHIAKYFNKRTADMIKNRFHSSIKKNMKFLEDLEAELLEKEEHNTSNAENFLKENKDVDMADLKRNFSSEIIVDYSSTSTDYDIFCKKSQEGLKIENIINLEYVREAIVNDDMLSWNIEDFFIL